VRRALALIGLMLAAGCGGGSGAASSSTATAAQAEPVRVVLRAATHRPRAGRPWLYSVRVTDASGRPLPARIRMQVLFGAAPVGKVDGGRTFSFVGTWREPRNSPVIWPKRSRGVRLVFEAVVTARGQTRKVDWWVQPS
jgi:hypothetical protein